MKNNKIRSVMENVTLSDEAKKRLKFECARYGGEEKKTHSMRFGIRAAVAAAVLAAMSITTYAMVGMGYFSFEKNDDTVVIGAALSDEVKEQISTEPVRAWHSGEDEISVKLKFAYMPEDMAERDNTPGKLYGTADYNRNITFSGFDLRRGDLSTAVKGIDDAERFTAGTSDAYLLYSDVEIAVYDKRLYVLFDDGQFVVEAIVGRGITTEEIKSIAAGMSVEETDDIEHALPISNEFGDGSSDANVPDVVVMEDDPVYEADLLGVGDTARYESYFGDYYNLTVEKLELADGIGGLDPEGFYDIDRVKQFTDDIGRFVSYNRTGIDYDAGKFTETVEMTKKMILVTVKFDSDTITDIKDIKSHLNSFSLAGLEVHDYGTVQTVHGDENFVINRIPGTNAVRHESEYVRNLGDGRWVVGYLLDEDECGGEFYYYNNTHDIYYSLEK